MKPSAFRVLFAFLISSLVSIPAFSQSSLSYQTVFDMNLAMATVLSDVTNARDMYHSTAIELRINWRDYEATQNTFNWTNVDAAVNNILNTSRGNMNLSIRVNLQSKPDWARPTTMGGTLAVDRFMADQTGAIFVTPAGFVNPDVNYNRVVLSFANDNSRTLVAAAYRNLVTHVKTYIQANLASRLNNLLVITPVVNYFEETEYPWMPVDWGVDYSSAAVTKFRSFLERKYNSISALNTEWTHSDVANNTASFSAFSQINPGAYNWNMDPASLGNNIKGYALFTGRRDWIQYRATELKVLVDALYQANRDNSIRFGVRLGSIHDPGIQMRGFDDVTPILENADWVHVAPIIEQEPGNGFEVQADYLRSICRFWSYKKGKTVRFSEESNWRGYGGHSVATLTAGWNNQIDRFRERGCSAHYYFGWDEPASWLQTTRNTYAAYISRLLAVGNTAIQNPNRTVAIHLSESRVAANVGVIPPMIFPDANFSNQVYNPNSLDFLTDYILSDGPAYANKYGTIHLPKGSYHISKGAYASILNKGYTSAISNATHFVSGWGQFLVTSGRSNWVDRPNNDVYKMIWLTRKAELAAIWPDANKTKAGQTAVDPNLDYIEWLVETNASRPEYPELNMNYANWDQDVRSVWLSRSDLQAAYPDGYHASGTGVYTPGASTMLDWVCSYGINENQALLGKFKGYPYLPILTATSVITPGSVNLSTDGKVDWAHYGLSTNQMYNRKSGVSKQIGDVIKFGSGTITRLTNNSTSYTWTGGAPAATATNTLTGTMISGVNSGFQIEIPADRSMRTVQLFVGVNKSRGRLDASLSDGSQPAISSTSTSNTSGRSNVVYTIRFASGTSGQVLKLKWALQTDHGSGSVTLQAASLW